MCVVTSLEVQFMNVPVETEEKQTYLRMSPKCGQQTVTQRDPKNGGKEYGKFMKMGTF